jgi:hypothetical protein
MIFIKAFFPKARAKDEAVSPHSPEELADAAALPVAEAVLPLAPMDSSLNQAQTPMPHKMTFQAKPHHQRLLTLKKVTRFLQSPPHNPPPVLWNLALKHPQTPSQARLKSSTQHNTHLFLVNFSPPKKPSANPQIITLCPCQAPQHF